MLFTQKALVAVTTLNKMDKPASTFPPTLANPKYINTYKDTYKGGVCFVFLPWSATLGLTSQ